MIYKDKLILEFIYKMVKYGENYKEELNFNLT